MEEETIVKFAEKLIANGFAVDYYGSGVFEIWVRGFDKGYARAKFKLFNGDIELLHVSGNFVKYGKGKEKEFFINQLIGLYKKAVLELQPFSSSFS